MPSNGSSSRSRSLIVFLASALVLAWAGIAAARTSSGPPWAAEGVLAQVAGGDADELVAQEVDPAEVEAYFDAFAEDCGTDVLGEADLVDAATLEAFGALIEGFDGGQTSHGVQGIRSVLANCEDHANDGLRNALVHLGMNWLRHYEHEQWLQDKFAAKWPDGKPGNGPGATSQGVAAGRPEAPGGAGAAHANPHATGSPGGGNAVGHGEH
ncbi:MAG TPA: hypothetical protein VE669_01705 [Actinomycetota bacterium]|nr:hypothetical protein [Actinomycetota bacterium]